MAAFPGFVGGTYLARSPLAADELAINVWPCTLHAPGAKAQRVLYGAPGSAIEVDLGTGQPVRGLFSQDGRTWAVSGDGLFEQGSPGVWLRRGTVAVSTQPATFASNGLNGLQLLITSGGLGYTQRLDTNVFAPITDADFPANVRMAAFLDGYFLIMTAGGTFYLSELSDGATWDAADVGSRTQASDVWQALLVKTPDVYLFGSFTTEVWYDTGAADFPFAPIPQAVMPVGIAAVHSATVVGGIAAWLGQTRDGERQVYLAEQYQPQAVSEPISPALQGYAVVDDAVGWGEVYDEHPFYVLTFPTQQITWAFDLKERAWHQRAFYVNGVAGAQRGRCHCFAGNTHLVGSRIDGTIYRQSLELYDDAGADLRWVRQPPRIWAENKRLFHQGLELHTEPGLGGMATDPLVDLEWSNDGGRTWSNVHQASLGTQGAYQTRVQWHRLGSARDRVYRFSGTAPVKRAFIDVSIDLLAGVA